MKNQIFTVVRNNEKKLEEGPPCLETLMNMGIPEGGRDNALYQFAVYAKKAFPDAWKDKVNEFNSKHHTWYIDKNIFIPLYQLKYHLCSPRTTPVDII